jgi:BON domain
MRKCASHAAFIAVGLIMAGCSFPSSTDGGRASGAQAVAPEKPSPAAAVKDRLVREGTVETSRVQVREEAGKIYLSGTVDSASEKMRAGQVAKGTPGVADVINDLQIAPSEGTAPLGTPGAR